MNFEFTKEWLVVSNFLTMTSKVEIKASKFSENWLPIYIFFHNRLKPSNFFQNQLPTSNFFRNRLPTSNFFQIRLPTSNFLQNRVPTSNFLPNRLPTSNFSTIIEGGTVPPSIAYFCSPVNEQNLLILNMASKVVYGFFVRSYDHFNFQKSKI